MNIYQNKLIIAQLSVIILATGCNTLERVPEEGTTNTPAKVAVVNLQPTEGNNVSGKVTFTPEPSGVQVVADITGLSPGKHGFHVHEKGDCSAPDASSAGGHYAPNNSPHGAPEDPANQRHVGDLGNITADASGNAKYNRVDNIISLDGANSIVGKAVIVHSGADDLTSQPSGDAGSRLACGVIQIS
ncbi:MAG: superoxide dismutase family protein [Rivularia sp. (in: cyanobacteria)]